MSEAYVGEIRMFAGNFAPHGWALCDGSLLQPSQHDALFSLYGTTYGGDGVNTFGLPDLRGRLPLHSGHGPGLTDRRLGAKSGFENETLTVNQLPSHGHDLLALTGPATSSSPQGNMLAQSQPAGAEMFRDQAQDEDMVSNAIGKTGGSMSHHNMMPSLGLNFICALFGIYPSKL